MPSETIDDVGLELDQPQLPVDSLAYQLALQEGSKFFDVFKALLEEGSRRLEKDASKIGDVQFWRIFNDAVKIAYALSKREEPDQGEDTTSLQELLDKLPPERRKEVVAAALEAKNAELTELKAEIEQLAGL